MKFNKYTNNLRDSLIWRFCLCIFIGLMVFFNSHVMTIAIVHGQSMYPSMEDGDFLLVDRIYKKLFRGDVILIQVPSIEFGGKYIVKRIISTGGENVVINYKNNTISVDGRTLSESYINRQESDPMTNGNGSCIMEYEVPEGYLFVVGDNRNYSSDSRSDSIGFIPENAVVGKVVHILRLK